MADNLIANAGSGGATFATDDIAGVHHPRTKVEWGPDGTVNEVDDASGKRLPVKVAEAIPAGTNNIGDVDVLTLPALPAGTNNIGDVDVLTLPALPAGTNNIGDVDVLSLPSGSIAATAAKTSDYDTGAGTDTVPMMGLALPASGGAVQGGTSTNPVRTDPTGTTTQPVSGTVTANLAAGTNNIGDVDVLTLPSIPAGTNNIGDVDVLSDVTPANLTASGSLTASGQSVEVDPMRGCGSAAVQVTGTWVATLQFEGTVDGANYFNVNAVQPTSGNSINQTSGNGQWFIGCAGLAKLRVRCSSFTSGTATVTIVASIGTQVANLGNPIPAGTNNIGDVDVLTVPAPLSTSGGGTEATALRVTIANDSTGVVSVDDNGASLTVDGTVAVSGTVTVDSELPAAAALADNTANPTVPGVGAFLMAFDGTNWDRVQTGAATGGALKVDGSAVTQPVSGTVTAAGGAAHDAAISGNPVRVAGRARTSDYTAVANDDTADLVTDTTGKQVTLPYSIPENFTDGVTDAITGTTDTAVIAAPGAGIRLYITSILVTNSHATVGTVVELKDGTTVKYRGHAASAGGGFSCSFPTPIRLTANTAFNAANVTTGSNTYVSATGYKAP